MRTKSFSVKKLLSLVLAVAMMATMVLPASALSPLYADGDAVATVIKGDGVSLIKQIVITFNSEITFDSADFTDANVTVNNGHSFGASTAEVDATDAKKLVITLADDADVADGDEITFANDIITDGTDAFNDVVTVDGNLTGATVSFDVPAGVTVTVEGGAAPAYYGIGTYAYKAEGAGFETVDGTFDVTDTDFDTPKNIPVAISEITAVDFTATAVATDVAATYGKADKIVIVFAEPINATAAEVFAQLDINTKTKDPVWTVDKTVLTLTVDGDIDNGTVVNYAKVPAIKTTSGKIVANGSATIAGNFDGAENLVTATSMTATIVKGAPFKPEVQATDSIVLVFNAPVATDDPITITADSETLTATADTTKTIYTIDLDGGENLEEVTEVAYGSIVATLNGSFGTAVAPKALRALATDEDGTAKVAGDKIYVSFSRPTNKVAISATALENACAALGTDASAVWTNSTELVITLGTDATIAVGDTLTLSGLGIMDEFDQKKADFTDLVVGGSFGTAIKPRVVKAVAVSKTGHSTASEGDQIVIMFNTLVTHNNITVRAKDGSFGVDFDNEGKDANGNNSFISWKDDGVTTLTITLGSEPDVELNKTAVSLDGIIKDAHSSTLECENIDTIKVKDGSFGIKILPELVNATIVKVSERPTASVNDKVVLVFSAPTNGENILSYLGGTTLFGDTAEASWNTPTNTVYTIKLGNNAGIADGNNIVLPSNTGLKDQYDIAEVPAATKALAGSFGEADAPKLLTATIIKTSTTPEAQERDQIVLVFSSRTNGTQIASKVLVNGNSNALGSSVSGLWSLDNTVYTISLGSGDKAVDDGDVISIDATCGLKDFYDVVDFDSSKTAELAGSFGEMGTEIPQIVSAVATSEDGADFIKISFNIETNLDTLNIDDTLKAALMAANTKLGDISVVTKDAKTLKIKLGETATIVNGDVIELASLGIKSKSTDTALGTTTIACSGYMAPVVKDIVAENGGKIKITYTSRTNEASINLEPSAALYGEGATASWVDAKTLLITLGEDYGITERGYISLDGLGIADGYSGTYSVSGQYKIQSGSFTSDELTVKTAIAKSATTTVTTAAAGDKITITFSHATNRPATLAEIVSEVKNGDAVVENAFGTGATCTWLTSQKLVITLGDAPAIARDNIIYFNTANITKVAGGALTTTSIALKGSFDGRAYYLSGNYVAQTATAKDHSFKVVVDNTSDAVAAKPTIVCVAYNGSTPVAISRVSAGIDETAEFVFTFSGSYTITNAKVYAFKGLFDDITDTTASPEVLAETKTINK